MKPLTLIIFLATFTAENPKETPHSVAFASCEAFKALKASQLGSN
jgi:hypothetical protein